jgi:hypothetical protein
MVAGMEPVRTRRETMASKKTREKLAKSVKADAQAVKDLAQTGQAVVESGKALAQDVKAVVMTAGAVETKALADAEKAAKKAALKKSREEKQEALEDTRRALLAEARKVGMQISEAGNVWRVRSEKSKLWMSISKKGSSLHMLGFNVPDTTICLAVTPEQAKARHIGNVRGEVDMGADRTALLALFAKALAAMNVAAVLGLIVRTVA